MTTIAISSGHGAKVAGACGIIREHEEAVRVVNQLAIELQHCGIDVYTFEDTVSTTQNENLNRIVDWHNSRQRDLDISVHFNAYEQVSKPMGCEVLYVTQAALASQLSAAIAEVGFINRGPKKRTDLFFLNNTAMPAVLLEVCFVDSEADCDIYAAEFKEICINLAEALGGDEDVTPPEPEAPDRGPDDFLFYATGKCSHFGGPDDQGVSASEGLAFHYALTEANQHLFLPLQPLGTTGLARRLNAQAVPYLACRWDYNVTPKTMLAESGQMALVTNVNTGRSTAAFPADWGPHDEKTGGRVADLSPALMRDLDLETDDIVEVVYPWKGD
jgi:N-acetylmuramoyl-L-alanine amidase